MPRFPLLPLKVMVPTPLPAKPVVTVPVTLTKPPLRFKTPVPEWPTLKLSELLQVPLVTFAVPDEPPPAPMSPLELET